ncbi:MAG: 3-hydroxyacyl-CoA dehydrogenase NAD-binding domain-containing protein [Desulfobacteraceae bacterium]|nr:3-hydroxyacyl-CoA dehydrogenase NAD-binding domain-containing protein [Desulfobacteraceae bacterium]
MENKIQKVAVIGTGLLGTQIAIQATCFDYEVFAYDPDEGSFKRVIQILDAMMKFTGKGPVVPMEEWGKLLL